MTCATEKEYGEAGEGGRAGGGNCWSNAVAVTVYVICKHRDIVRARAAARDTARARYIIYVKYIFYIYYIYTYYP